MLFKMTEPEAKSISPPHSELTLPCRDARGSFQLGLGDAIWQGHILVTGGTGTGKTTVIRWLLARCRYLFDVLYSTHPDSALRADHIRRRMQQDTLALRRRTL